MSICINIVAFIYQVTLYNDICDEITSNDDDYNDCSSSSSKAFTYIWGILTIIIQIYCTFIVKRFIDIVLTQELNPEYLPMGVHDQIRASMQQDAHHNELVGYNPANDPLVMGNGVPTFDKRNSLGDGDTTTYDPPTHQQP